jgi:hypothetical protein
MVNHPNRSITPTQFREGQDVEVWNGFDNLSSPGGASKPLWTNAKIVREWLENNTWVVVFPDNSRAVFDAEHVREAKHIGSASGPPSGTVLINFD